MKDQDSRLPEGSSIETEETDSSYVLSVNVVNAPLTDSDMGAEVLPDGRTRFSFKQEGSTDSSSSVLDLGAGSMKLRIAFPGKVVEASPEFLNNGDNSISLSTTLDKPLDVYTISEASGSESSSSSTTTPIIIGLALLLLIGYGVMRNRALAAKVAQVEPTSQAEQVNWPKPGE